MTTNWSSIISQAQMGQDGSSRAMAMVYQDTFCQKKAYFMFKKYENILPDATEWKDILIEAAIRFIKMIHNGNIPRDGDAVFWRICKLLCLEMMRKKDPKNEFMGDEEASHDLPVGNNEHHVWCKTKLMHYVDKLSPQYKKLMLVMYFHKPPEENLEKIAEIIGIDKKAVQPMAWSCRKKLAELVGRNLDECTDTLFDYGI